ncbi:hypothetical protein LOC68_23460 [Blastopirellula sp. JC732]|uniref:DUF4175 family protein n=1 Tax=Blastopirellula sediminis TaxID=2894196 RepID=A0A9X1SIA3_9BACT|nr:hypothetical protein [Blastopirellula sediminis]MCC9605337.1 hypothetical protein [Blastopirellula sediminis]MCC9631363.1 hypothetical protein [Blastopirellula sediminis]
MKHPIIQQVERIRNRAMRLVRLRALLWCVAALLGAICGIALLDYLVHSEDAGTRYFFSLAAWGSCIAIVIYLLPAAWKWKPSLLSTAQRLESFFPQFRDRISSSLEFLESGASTGSLQLQRNVVAETEADLQSYDLEAAVNRDLYKRGALVAIAAIAVASILAVAAPRYAQIAMTRLAAPWSDAQWPRVNQLQFVDPPSSVAVGESVSLEVIDGGGKLPDGVTLQVDRGDRIESLPMEFDFGKSVMKRTLANVTTDLRYRAYGGDDDAMSWRTLKAVDPPRIIDVQVTVVPPEYTEWESTPSPRVILALQGSQINIAGKVDQPIAMARLHLENSEGKRTIPLKVGDDQLSLLSDPEQPFQLTASGVYWLEVETSGGLVRTERDRFQARAVQDKTPELVWKKPEENIFVTPTANIELAADAIDDLGLARVLLKYMNLRATDAGATEIELWTAPADAQLAKSLESLSANPLPPVPVTYQWQLKDLQGLQPGDVLEATLVAYDRKPQEGVSLPRRITIVTPEQMEERIIAMQRRLITQLSEAAQAQAEARSETSAVEIAAGEGKPLGPQDRSRLQNAELRQRRVRREIADPQTGVASQIKKIQREMEQNGLDDPDTKEQLAALKAQTEKMASQELASIENKLGEAKRDIELQENAPPAERAEQASEMRGKLSETVQQQRNAENQLEEMISGLSQWDTYRRFALDLRSLRERQQDLQERTKEEQAATIGKTPENLDPAERSERKRLATDQADLANQLDRIQSRMREMEQQLAGKEPAAAETLKDAVEQQRQQAISQKMREAGVQLAQNQMGEAANAQSEVDKELGEMLDILNNRRENRLKQLSEKLKEAEQELKELTAKQKGLQDKLKQAAKTQDPQERQRQLERLSQEQKNLQEQAERLARKLERLRADKAASAVRNSAQKLEKAADNAANDDAGASLEQQEQAERDLEDAQQELAEKQKQVEKDLADEQSQRLRQSIESMVTQQKTVVREIDRLREIVGSRAPNEAEGESIRLVSQLQKGLMTETADFARTISKAAVFHLSLTTAADLMRETARGLDARDLSDLTQRTADQAATRLEQLLVAMDESDAEENQPQKNDQGEQQGQQSGGDQQGNQDGISQIAQLKLLKLMQQGVNDLTAEAAARLAKESPPSVELEIELARLAKEQGDLAELALELTKPAKEDIFEIEEEEKEADPADQPKADDKAAEENL